MKNITDKLQSRGAQALADEELVAVALAENPNDDSACAMAEEVQEKVLSDSDVVHIMRRRLQSRTQYSRPHR